MSQISAGSSRSLSALFDHRSDAEKAIDRLYDLGLARDTVRLVPGYESDTPITDRSDTHRGFFDKLADFFMPEEDRHGYAEGLSRGGYLVVVDHLSDADHDRALDILDDEGTIDMDQRENEWRNGGWTGYQGASAGGYDADNTATGSTAFGGSAADPVDTLGGSRSSTYPDAQKGFASGTSASSGVNPIDTNAIGGATDPLGSDAGGISTGNTTQDSPLVYDRNGNTPAQGQTRYARDLERSRARARSYTASNSDTEPATGWNSDDVEVDDRRVDDTQRQNQR